MEKAKESIETLLIELIGRIDKLEAKLDQNVTDIKSAMAVMAERIEDQDASFRYQRNRQFFNESLLASFPASFSSGDYYQPAGKAFMHDNLVRVHPLQQD
ncbi:MAG: hypothetical protein KDI54_18655 [Gammaproteobacteria bacterium]|nr:hypothetical protein [Gammaproteobacteria bacterium]